MAELRQNPDLSQFGKLVVVGPLPPPAGSMANQTRQLIELLRAAQANVTLVQTNAPYRPAWIGRIPAKILQSDDLSRHLFFAGLAEVQRYTWKCVAPLLASVYRQAIAGARPTSFGTP